VVADAYGGYDGDRGRQRDHARRMLGACVAAFVDLEKSEPDTSSG